MHQIEFQIPKWRKPFGHYYVLHRYALGLWGWKHLYAGGGYK